MASSIEILGDQDVISGDAADFLDSNTYIVSEWLEAARERLNLNGECCDEEWLVRETECKVLRVGESQGWRQGQLKIRLKVMLEFEPEVVSSTEAEPIPGGDESPLDRLRA
jgi:KGK domain